MNSESNLITVSVAVPIILKTNPDQNVNSIISVYKKLGFKTTWISSQPYNSIINRIASEADELISIDKILQRTKYNKVGKIKDLDLSIKPKDL